MGLITKYRPRTLEEMLGNEHLLKSVDSVLSREDPPHAFLLTGPSGCGKTTLARIIAARLGAYDPDSDANLDFHELNAANFRGIDTAREIMANAQIRPIGGKARVWLLDECHQLTRDAQPALLKALEEPPPHAFFVLATTEPAKLIPTIRNRCVEFELKALSDKKIYKLIKRVSRKEKTKLPSYAYDRIVERANGSPRKALSLLEKILEVADDEKAITSILIGFEEDELNAIELCRCLANRPSWKKLSGVLKKLRNEDPEKVRRSVLGYFTTCILSKGDPYYAMILNEFSSNFFDSGFPGLVTACYNVFLEVRPSKRNEDDIPF